MKITKYFSEYCRSYVVSLREEGLGEIRIASNVGISDINVWSAPEINWPGCGGQSIAKTQVFMGALSAAVALAATMNSNMPPGRVVEMLKNEFGATDAQICFN